MTLRFLMGQAEYLRQSGIEVCAISSPGEALEGFKAAEGVECFAIPMEREIAPLRDLVALARLLVLLRRIRPDIVDAHTPKAGLLGVAAAWLAGVPVRIYHLHGLRFITVRGVQRQLLIAAERMASSLATRVLCVSHSVAALASAFGLGAEEKLGVLLAGSISGVDTDRFCPSASPGERSAARTALGIPAAARVIGFVGRLVCDKGIVELAAAWRTLRGEMPDLWLVLVGPLETQDPIPEAVASELLSDPRVRALGIDWDTPKYYRALDVVALPTHREGFPVVPLEAAAMALPIVATRVPGCTDAIFDGVTGTLVPPGDEGALTSALRAYLNDRALRERHGTAGRERVLRDFQQERIWSALRQEYLNLASRAPGVASRASGDALPLPSTDPRRKRGRAVETGRRAGSLTRRSHGDFAWGCVSRCCCSDSE